MLIKSCANQLGYSCENVSLLFPICVRICILVALLLLRLSFFLSLLLLLTRHVDVDDVILHFRRGHGRSGGGRRLLGRLAFRGSTAAGCSDLASSLPSLGRRAGRHHTVAVVVVGASVPRLAIKRAQSHGRQGRRWLWWSRYARYRCTRSLLRRLMLRCAGNSGRRDTDTASSDFHQVLATSRCVEGGA